MGKLNGNNEKQGDYYLGLDIGTDSVGWAVTDTGEDYNILKRYAFLEIDRQEKLENENRDYTKFAEYYQKASQMYEEQLQNNQTDPEMELLDHVYQQVQAGGWL